MRNVKPKLNINYHFVFLFQKESNTTVEVWEEINYVVDKNIDFLSSYNYTLSPHLTRYSYVTTNIAQISIVQRLIDPKYFYWNNYEIVRGLIEDYETRKNKL